MLKTYDFVGHLYAEQPLATCSKDLMDQKGRPGSPTPVPSIQLKTGTHLLFPATGIRGALRRCALSAIRDHVIAKTGNQKPFSLDQHYFLSLGGVKGKGETERISVALEPMWRAKNPLLSLFGAGDAGVLGFVEGHLAVGNAICDDPIPAVVFSGARSDEFWRNRGQVKYLSEDDVADLVARANGNSRASKLRAELKKVQADMKKLRKEPAALAEAAARAQALEDEIEANKQASGASDNSVGMPLAGWQAIPAHQTLSHRMLLRRSNPLELGLLIKSLSYFAADPVLGAHIGAGCGLVSGEWEVYEVSIGARRKLGVASFEALNPISLHNESGSDLTDALSSFEAWIVGPDADFRIPEKEVA